MIVDDGTDFAAPRRDRLESGAAVPGPCRRGPQRDRPGASAAAGAAAGGREGASRFMPATCCARSRPPARSRSSWAWPASRMRHCASRVSAASTACESTTSRPSIRRRGKAGCASTRTTACPTAKPPAQFHARVMDAVSGSSPRIPAETVVVVTHGGVLDMIYRTARSLGLNGPRQSDIPNAGFNRVRVREGGIDILAWADIAASGRPAAAAGLRSAKAGGDRIPGRAPYRRERLAASGVPTRAGFATAAAATAAAATAALRQAGRRASAHRGAPARTGRAAHGCRRSPQAAAGPCPSSSTAVCVIARAHAPAGRGWPGTHTRCHAALHRPLRAAACCSMLCHQGMRLLGPAGARQAVEVLHVEKRQHVVVAAGPRGSCPDPASDRPRRCRRAPAVPAATPH